MLALVTQKQRREHNIMIATREILIIITLLLKHFSLGSEGFQTGGKRNMLDLIHGQLAKIL